VTIHLYWGSRIRWEGSRIRAKKEQGSKGAKEQWSKGAPEEEEAEKRKCRRAEGQKGGREEGRNDFFESLRLCGFEFVMTTRNLSHKKGD